MQLVQDIAHSPPSKNALSDPFCSDRTLYMALAIISLLSLTLGALVLGRVHIFRPIGNLGGIIFIGIGAVFGLAGIAIAACNRFKSLNANDLDGKAKTASHESAKTHEVQQSKPSLKKNSVTLVQEKLDKALQGKFKESSVCFPNYVLFTLEVVFSTADRTTNRYRQSEYFYCRNNEEFSSALSTKYQNIFTKMNKRLDIIFIPLVVQAGAYILSKDPDPSKGFCIHVMTCREGDLFEGYDLAKQNRLVSQQKELTSGELYERIPEENLAFFKKDLESPSDASSQEDPHIMRMRIACGYSFKSIIDANGNLIPQIRIDQKS